MKIVVYTAIFGKHSGLIPQPKYVDIDYICFTDSLLNPRGWDIRLVDPISNDTIRSNRYYKILPHLYFQDYDISIYMDSNVLISADPRSLMYKYFNGYSLLAFNHNNLLNDQRNCIYDEHQHILKLGSRKNLYKDDPKIMESQINKFRKEGYPEKNGLIHGAVLIRKHNDPELIRVMEHWWSIIEKGSRRDQLSFNYVAWKENFIFGYIPGDPLKLNPWFNKMGSKRKNYTKKLLQFKLKKTWSKYGF